MCNGTMRVGAGPCARVRGTRAAERAARRRTAAPRTRAAIAAAAAESAAPQAPAPAPGLLCVPGLASPADLEASWRRRWRPAVEALVSAVGAAKGGSDDDLLLRALDDLLLLLRDAAALAAHCRARSGGAAWREAAASVAAGCDKYERECMQCRAHSHTRTYAYNAAPQHRP